MQHDATPLVAHVIHRLDVGGLENGLVNLVNNMPAQAFRHAIVCLSGFDEAFRARIRRPDVTIVSLDKRAGKDPGSYRRMWSVLKRLQPDIVHSRNLGTVDMQWVAALAGVPCRVHGEHGWEATDPQGLSARSLRIRRACRPVIQAYVAMSRDIARWLQQVLHVPGRRIHQLYSGVDTDRFCPHGPGATDCPWRDVDAENESGSRRPLVVGTVGRLDPVKRQDSLLHAVASLRREDPGLGGRLRAVVAGSGPRRHELENAAAALGLADRVWFTGSRDDVPQVMRSFDVFVLPSMNEGISNTILEAMATGLPVVAARVGGNPELVEDGVTGMLYDLEDPNGLPAAVRRYAMDSELRIRHGQAGRQRVLANFSLEVMVQRYVSLYDGLLRKN